MRVTTGRSESGIAVGIGDPDESGRTPSVKGASVLWRLSRTLITRRGGIPSWRGVMAFLAFECLGQTERLTLWTPVAFGLGAATYLGLGTEPSMLVEALGSLLCLFLLVAALVCSSRRAVGSLCFLAAFVLLGFVVAKFHSDQIAAPVSPAGLGVTRIVGWVVDVETPSETGERLLIAPVQIGDLLPRNTPTRIRLVVRSPNGPEGLPRPGSAIRVLSLLDPPPGPASPGAYDFARDAWFEGIGGVGLALKPPTEIRMPPPPFPLRLEMAVNEYRWSTACALASNIRSAMGRSDGGASGLAVAVTTSHQDWLTPDHRDDLRGSGLAHMLAIAGLHTAAVTGCAFFAFRFLIAAWPWLALRVSGKKVAAGATLFVVAGYLLLSGAHPPARRAAITASVALFAILFDRRAVSLHSLALAALCILVSEPEVVVAPGFEMSFCATASLIALAEAWRRPTPVVGLSWPLAWLQKARDGIVAMAAVSLVAGAATGPFAIQHFNRVSNYGVLANLTADFLASAVLMPGLALSLLVQAIGLRLDLAAPVYWLAGWAARAIVWLAHIFAVAPGASFSLSSAPEIALAISYLGIIFACLWKGRLRWIGLPMSAAVALWPRPIAPVAWLAADGNDAAIVVSGREIPLKPGARLYATQLWAQRRGFTLEPDASAIAAAQSRLFDCDRKACAPIGRGPLGLAAWWSKRPPSEKQFDALCQGADILISRAEPEPAMSCRNAIVLSPKAFREGGSAEIYSTSSGWRILWSQPMRGNRPWTISDSGV